MAKLDHKHIIVNAVVRKPPKEGDEELVKDWLRRLISAVKMKIVIGPHVHYCKADENEGITASVNIETSHASIHCWDKLEIPSLKFDLYSCSDFQVNAVLGAVKEFDPYFLTWVLIDRDEGIRIVDRGQEQIIKVIDILTEQERIAYLEAQRLKPQERTENHKSARSRYAFLSRRYSLSGSAYQLRRRQRHESTLSCIKARAKKNGVPFDLSLEWYGDEFDKAKSRWPKLKIHTPKQEFWSADVDRVVPSLGYTKDNCRIIPHGLNVAKWQWSIEELKELSLLLSEEVST